MTICKGLSVALLGLSTLPLLTGCHSTDYTASGKPLSEPSGGGATVAQERPGAGAGAQVGMGAAIDVPEATQKGAGASDLSKPGDVAFGSQRGTTNTSGAELTTPTTPMTAPVVAGGPITDLAALSATADPGSYAGQTVDLSNVQVQQVVSDRLVSVSGSNGQRLYVRLPQPAPDLKPGDPITVVGTINRVPATPANLGLNQAATQALQGQPIYIDAQQVQVPSH